MGQAGRFLRRWESNGRGGYTFFCPGCNEGHTISTEGGAAWTFDGNLDRPTFAPSVLLRSGHYVSGHHPGEPCWCTFNEERAKQGKEQSGFKCTVCHSFVRDGSIQFLDDCTHALKGKTVPLPELPEHLRDA